MSTINDTSVITDAVQPYYDRNLLTRTVPFLVHDLFADRRPLPKKNSDQIKFRKYGSLTPATTPITEGVVPDGNSVSITDVTFTVDQYGDYLKYTDKVDLTNADPVLTEFGMILGEQAGETIDEIRRDSYVGGTVVRRAGGVASRGDIITVPSTTDFKVIERAMLDAKCRYFTKMVDPQNGYATSPIRPAWFVIAHSDAKTDLEDMTGFISVEKYASTTMTYDSEIGAWQNFRFIITNKAKKWADTGGTAVTNSLKYTTANTAADIYAMLIFSEHAVAVSDLEGEGLTNIIKARGSGGTEDPLNQYGTTGWAAWLAQGILDDTRMYRLEHGVSAL
jgi:N4-gp56 family major capsid protein